LAAERSREAHQHTEQIVKEEAELAKQ
jgi:hypothetical protein